jgi:site-specific recombinase XerD
MSGALIPTRRDLPESADPLAMFAEFLRLDVAAGDASEHTIRSYFGNVRQFSRWCQDRGIMPAHATEADLKDYRAWLVGQYARATTATKLAAVRRFYQMAQSRGLRPDNPAEGLKAPRDRTDAAERRKWLSLGEVTTVLAQVKGNKPAALRDRAILALLIECGPRVAELASLDVADVDLERGEIRVTGKGNKTRTLLPVGPAVDAMRRWLEARELVAMPGETAVFVALPRKRQGRGERMTTQAIRDLTNKYLERAGCKRPGVSCHSFRHSFATLSLAAGATLQNVSDALGHASVTTTQVYAKIVDRRRGNPSQFMADLLGQVA